MGHANGVKPILPPYNPAPFIGSLYQYCFGDIHRRKSFSVSYKGTMDITQLGPNVISKRLVLQMQVYALNDGGMLDLMVSMRSSPCQPRSHFASTT
jgi:hypothetical protein